MTEKDDLASRIEAARDSRRPRKGSNFGRKYNALSLAWRMVLELVVGTGLGFAIGYGLDALLNTQPALMIVFGMLGFAAGVRTVMATAQDVSRDGGREPATPSEGAAERVTRRGEGGGDSEGEPRG